MPVRKIPKNYISVTGSFSSLKNDRMMGYESPLERDHMILLEFDPTVERFEEQPVSLTYKGQKRGNIPYTPDTLVHFVASAGKPPELIEVKHTRDLEKNEEKYRPKFEAAKEQALKQGWLFKIVTEKEIRITRLANLKWLRAYQHMEPNSAIVAAINQMLDDAGGQASVADIQDKLRAHGSCLEALATMWYLVATHQLHFDWSEPITNQTMIHRSPLP